MAALGQRSGTAWVDRARPGLLRGYRGAAVGPDCRCRITDTGAISVDSGHRSIQRPRGVGTARRSRGRLRRSVQPSRPRTDHRRRPGPSPAGSAAWSGRCRCPHDSRGFGPIARRRFRGCVTHPSPSRQQHPRACCPVADGRRSRSDRRRRGVPDGRALVADPGALAVGAGGRSQCCRPARARRCGNRTGNRARAVGHRRRRRLTAGAGPAASGRRGRRSGGRNALRQTAPSSRNIRLGQ